jgi:hypothetical protein
MFVPSNNPVGAIRICGTQGVRRVSIVGLIIEG